MKNSQLSEPRMSLKTPFKPNRLRKYHDRALDGLAGDKIHRETGNSRYPSDVEIRHQEISSEEGLEPEG